MFRVVDLNTSEPTWPGGIDADGPTAPWHQFGRWLIRGPLVTPRYFEAKCAVRQGAATKPASAAMDGPEMYFASMSRYCFLPRLNIPSPSRGVVIGCLTAPILRLKPANQRLKPRQSVFSVLFGHAADFPFRPIVSLMFSWVAATRQALGKGWSGPHSGGLLRTGGLRLCRSVFGCGRSARASISPSGQASHLGAARPSLRRGSVR